MLLHSNIIAASQMAVLRVCLIATFLLCYRAHRARQGERASATLRGGGSDDSSRRPTRPGLRPAAPVAFSVAAAAAAAVDSPAWRRRTKRPFLPSPSASVGLPSAACLGGCERPPLLSRDRQHRAGPQVPLAKLPTSTSTTGRGEGASNPGERCLRRQGHGRGGAKGGKGAFHVPAVQGGTGSAMFCAL